MLRKATINGDLQRKFQIKSFGQKRVNMEKYTFPLIQPAADSSNIQHLFPLAASKFQTTADLCQAVSR